jgi:hypothetical protein
VVHSEEEVEMRWREKSLGSFMGAGFAVFLCLITVSLVGGAGPKDAEDETIPYPDIPRMTKEQLKEIAGKPGVVVIDCRPEEQWRASEQTLPAAVHENPMEVKTWAGKYAKDTTIVIY